MISEESICLVDEAGQNSIWFADQEIPLGCKQEGSRGNKEICLESIKTWTDMRPISLRKQSDAA